ncbi:MAG: hypothetical protein AAFY02_10675 [Pseudomonadota bacterium]
MSDGEILEQIIGAGSRTIFGTRDNPRTVMVMRNFDLPGVWGVNFGIAGSATQFGVVFEPDTGPGWALSGLLNGMNSIADRFDMVIVGEQWLQDVSSQQIGLQYSDNIEIRWSQGNISDQVGNGVSATGGFGFVGGGAHWNDAGEFQGVSFLVGPTYGAKLATTSTSAVYFDFDEWALDLKLYYINDRPFLDLQPDDYAFISETGMGSTKGGEFFSTSEYDGPTLKSPREIVEYIEEATDDQKFCFVAGTIVQMASGAEKRIECVKVGDRVETFDSEGVLVSRKITDVWSREVPHILDLFGTKVTPGHAFECGDGPYEGQYRPLIEILLEDGALVRANGDLVRAATGCLVGSDLDRKVAVLWTTDPRASSADLPMIAEVKWQESYLRLGQRLIRKDGSSWTVAQSLAAQGLRPTEDGLIEYRAGDPPEPLYRIGQPIRPEQYVLARSGLTLEEIMNAPGSRDDEIGYCYAGHVKSYREPDQSGDSAPIVLGEGFTPPEGLIARSTADHPAFLASNAKALPSTGNRHERRKARRKSLRASKGEPSC